MLPGTLRLFAFRVIPLNPPLVAPDTRAMGFWNTYSRIMGADFEEKSAKVAG